MPNTKASNPSKHIAQPRTTHPHPHSQRLFFPFIEHAEDDHSARVDTRLEDAQECARSCKARKVVRRRMAHEHDAPDNDGSGHKLSNREALEEETGWVLPEEIAEIEEGSEPTELGADEVGVFAEVEDGCVGECGLVDGLEHVGYTSGFTLAECTMKVSFRLNLL